MASLITAIDNNNLGLVKYLLKQGENVNYQIQTAGNYISTPLILAIRYNDENIFDELLKYNPDLNLTDNGDYTALMYAVKKQNTYGKIFIKNKQ